MSADGVRQETAPSRDSVQTSPIDAEARELPTGRTIVRSMRQARACASSLNGANYATSVVTLGESTPVSWGRGYDAGGSQVRGATKGGYVFDRLDGPAAP